MDSSGKKKQQAITVLGSGAVGSFTALHLKKLGHDVTIIDPIIQKSIQHGSSSNGTTASLGVVMGNTFHRSKGRAWLLRQRSMELWPKWIEELNTPTHPLEIKTPLIKLVHSQEEEQLIKKIIKERKDLGIEALSEEWKNKLAKNWPVNQFEGLISYNEGRIDPIALQLCLRAKLKEANISTINSKVLHINRLQKNKETRWCLDLDNHDAKLCSSIILCNAMGSEALIQPLGHIRKLIPILGQVLEIKINKEATDSADLPAVLNTHGFNLIPQSDNHLLIGATLEPGIEAKENLLINMKELNGWSPDWIKNAAILNNWYGIRAKPVDQPAPILETLEPGLIISTGHYRNGILLAPVSAEWTGEEISKSHFYE